MKSHKSLVILVIAFACSGSVFGAQIARAQPSAVYDDEIDVANSRIINQREFSYAQCEEHVPSIATFSINGCFFVVVYDAAKKFGVAMHWDDDTQRESLEQVYNYFEQQGSNLLELEATIVGGWDHPDYFYSKWTGNFLLRELKRWGISKVAAEHMYEKRPGSNSLSLPIETLRRTRFLTLSFDVCEGKLRLSDQKVPPLTDEDTLDRIYDCARTTPLEEGVPYTGCEIKFVPPIDLGHDEL